MKTNEGLFLFFIITNSIKVSEFNVDSMKLQKENGAYKVKLDGVNGILESDATVKRKYVF